MDTTSLFTIRKLSEIKIRRSVFISPGASKYFPSTSLQKKKKNKHVATTKGNSLSPIPCNNPVTAEPLWRPHIQQTKKNLKKKKKSQRVIKHQQILQRKSSPSHSNLGMFFHYYYHIMLKYHANKLTKLTRQEGFLVLHSRDAKRKEKKSKESYMIINTIFFKKKEEKKQNSKQKISKALVR